MIVYQPLFSNRRFLGAKPSCANAECAVWLKVQVLSSTCAIPWSAVLDDRIPVAVGLFLAVRRDLEREGFAVFEGRAAIEAQTGKA